MHAQPDVAERGVVADDEDDGQAGARRTLHLEPVHAHAAVAREDDDGRVGTRRLRADPRRDAPAHGAEPGGGEKLARAVAVPVVHAEGPVRAAVDDGDGVARHHLAALRDHARGMDRHALARGVDDVVIARQRAHPFEPLAARGDAGAQGLGRVLGRPREPAHEGAGMTADERITIEVAADMDGGDVDRDDPKPRGKLRRPVHGIAHIQRRAEHDQEIERLLDQRLRRMPRAGVAEHAERQLVVLGKKPFGVLGRGDRQMEALGGREQVGRAIVGDHAAADEQRHARGPARVLQHPPKSLRRLHVERPRAQDVGGKGLNGRVDVAGLDVVRDAQVHGRASVIEHALDGAAQLVAEQAHVGDAVGLRGDRRDDAPVVVSAGGGVLEQPHALHRVGDLAGEHEHGRLIGEGGRKRRDRIGEAGAANAQAHAELAAGARIAVRHVGGAALLRRDDRNDLGHARERRQKGIDQPARDQEDAVDAVGRERAQNEIGALHFPMSSSRSMEQALELSG